MPRSSAVLVVIAAVVLLTGCAGEAGPESVGTPAPPGVALPSTPVPADTPPGTVSCARLAAAIQRSSLMEPGVIDDIDRMSRTADAPVADAAGRLSTAYADAVAATGTADEPDRIAAVSAAAADMSGVCDDSGLETVG